METEFLYWRHLTPPGIKVEEISGADDKNGKIWLEMARQVYCENGKDDYRQILHLPSGAPLLQGELYRISISHTDHFLAVASLPKTPEVTLAEFSLRAAMGIDVEKLTRTQVLKIRDKFLSEEELLMVAPDDVEKNIIAWTAKEALYKAALTPGLEFCRDIKIVRLPELQPASGIVEEGKTDYGEALIKFPSGQEIPMQLYSYESEGCCVTLAFSPKCAKFKGKTRSGQNEKF